MEMAKRCVSILELRYRSNQRRQNRNFASMLACSTGTVPVPVKRHRGEPEHTEKTRQGQFKNV